MLKFLSIFIFILLMAGCHKKTEATSMAGSPSVVAPVSSPLVGAPAPLVTNDECWRPGIKQAMQDAMGRNLDVVFSEIRGQSASLDAITASPRSVKTENFGLKSIDVGAGRLVCDAWVTVIFNTKRHGNIIVPETDVKFDVSQTENGPMVTMQYAYFVGFMESFSAQLKKLGIKLVIQDEKSR